MTTQTETVKVVSTDPASQGPFVVINAADFDPTVHKPFEEEPAADAPRKARAPKQPTTEA
jgi:hypothetical protein